MSYEYKQIGDKQIHIAQRMNGWNVSTWKNKGNKVQTLKDVNTNTLAEAKKEYTKQKRIASGKTPIRKKRTKRRAPKKQSGFYIPRFV